jgi:hypothetical protein
MSTGLNALTAQYTINLANLSTALMKHNRPTDTMRTLIASPSASYTGIIIMASDPLRIHGRHTSTFALPCIFPKVWDTDMNLIYERSMIDRQLTDVMVKYVSHPRVFRDTPSGIDPDVELLVGANPLRIIANGVFGVRPTDPIIDSDDALLIISSENNRRLLREGKVVIVLDDSVIRTTF